MALLHSAKSISVSNFMGHVGRGSPGHPRIILSRRTLVKNINPIAGLSLLCD